MSHPKFVQIATLPGDANWPGTLYALDESGEVWWFNGVEWVVFGKALSSSEAE